MTKEQMWEELKQYLIANRNNARNVGGKYNAQGGTLDNILEKMQKLDPEITNEEIYYEGKEFYPENAKFLPKN